MTASRKLLHGYGPNHLSNFSQNHCHRDFGTSPAYLGALAKAGLEPGRDHDLSHLVAMGCTGSPLTSELYQWVYDHIKPDIWLGPISGGTDIAAAFVGSCPILPVRAGTMQCRSLGVKVEAFDEKGHSVVDQVGELVVTEPMPSMPLYLWNDPSGTRYRESYFETFPGIWHHGDWIKIASDGSAVIYGRSDSTINRQGVRMGSSEIYRAVEALPEITDSLIVDLEYLGRPSFMPLFVVLAPGTQLSPKLLDKIRYTIRDQVSPRHIPDTIYAIPDVPRTLNGKKLEVPIRKLLMGFPKDKSVDPDAMANPASLQFFLTLANELGQQNDQT
jgi:acetoacetyl-CoA synthetase